MNITLIGMAGAGKSTVGEEIAKRSGYRFVDTDKMIEARYALRLQEVVDLLGEPGFLAEEERMVLSIGKVDDCVISTGGSVVYSEKAMDYLKENSVVVFLDAPCGCIRERIDDHSKRGIIGIKRKDFDTLYEERVPLYRRYADVTIDLSGCSDVGTIADNIIQKTIKRD